MVAARGEPCADGLYISNFADLASQVQVLSPIYRMLHCCREILSDDFYSFPDNVFFDNFYYSCSRTGVSVANKTVLIIMKYFISIII